MSFGAAEAIARALLFEGYVLYPYRASSLKNRQRWSMGTLYPKQFCTTANENDHSSMQTECLVAGVNPRVRVSVRYLQSLSRQATDSAASHEAVERRVEPEELSLVELASQPRELRAEVPEDVVGDTGAPLLQKALAIRVVVASERLDEALFKLSVTVENETESTDILQARTAAQLESLLSAHTLLACRDGEFISLLEPPDEFASHVEGCRNVRVWPVLVGAQKRGDTLLSSPIILYDCPSIAAESPGDLFDATEIDEILSLRILTLTPDERREAVATNARARELVERTESLGEDELLALHGIWRRGSTPAPRPFETGDHVVLRPARGGDVLDLALAGEAATITGIEEDLEGRTHYLVTVDADPGKDLGELGQHGHRFFFAGEELERVG